MLLSKFFWHMNRTLLAISLIVFNRNNKDMKMTVQNKNSRRRNRLQLESLESRENPNGTVVASLSAGGVLSLSGDELDNQVQLQVTATGAVLTGLNGTQISVDGVASGSGTLDGNVKSINTSLKDGNDTLSLDGAAAFALAGNAMFNLGSGNNTLDLVTTSTLNIGGHLKVRGSSGTDTVNIQAAAGSTIAKGATVALGSGGNSVNIDTVTIDGNSGLAISASAGDDTVDLNAVSVAKGGISISTGSGALNVDIEGGTTASGNVSLKGGTTDLDVLSGTFAVGGNLRVTGSTGADVSVSGAGTSIDVDGHATVSGGAGATALVVNADRVNVGKNLTISGSGGINASVDTASASTVDGNLFVRGGAAIDTINLSSDLGVNGNVSLRLGGGNNSIILGDGNANMALGRNVTIITGSGNDTVLFDRVAIAGRTSVNLGSGIDVFTAESGTTFGASATASTAINLGAGVDTLNLANDLTATAGVTFAGRTNINTGDDEDVVNLGLAGGTFSLVTFQSDSTLNGGTGIDVFTLANSQFTGNLSVVGLP